MSRSLLKLVDVSLLPAALMVLAKLLGVFLMGRLLGISVTMQDIPGQFLVTRPVTGVDELTSLSTYSDLFMFAIMALGFSIILVQATHFHDTHIKPSLLIKLNNNNLAGLVRSSFDIYHRAAVWLIFLWVATLLIWVNIFIGKTEFWLGIAIFFASAVFTTLLLQDVYKEVELGRKNLGNQQAFS